MTRLQKEWREKVDRLSCHRSQEEASVFPRMYQGLHFKNKRASFFSKKKNCTGSAKKEPLIIWAASEPAYTTATLSNIGTCRLPITDVRLITNPPDILSSLLSQSVALSTPKMEYIEAGQSKT